jgi:hypothetical protein
MPRTDPNNTPNYSAGNLTTMEVAPHPSDNTHCNTHHHHLKSVETTTPLITFFQFRRSRHHYTYLIFITVEKWYMTNITNKNHAPFAFWV